MSDNKFYKYIIDSENCSGEWEKLPIENQKVEIQYKNSTNEAFFRDGKFVNYYGFELFNVIGWREYNE